LIRLVSSGVDRARWSRLSDTIPESNLLQTWAYGEAKLQTGPWTTERCLILKDDREVGVVQASIRKIPLIGGGLVWINRGPLLCEPFRNDSQVWREVLESLRAHWVDTRRMLLRIALPQREAIDVEQFIPAGFRLAESGEGAHSARLDLTESLEALRRQLDQKWRHGLNKAERANAIVESGANGTLLPAVLADYSSMLAHKNFPTSVTPDLLQKLDAASSPAERLWSVIARVPEGLAGFVLIARYGNTAEYLAGSSNPSGRSWNVGNLLLWRAIAAMKEQGYRWFDVGGMDPKRTPPGIYHFKAGLRAKAYELPPEIEAYRPGLTSFAVRRAIRRTRASAAQ
jgi:hypothetical protein